MTFTQCKDCDRIKFTYVGCKEVFWKELTPVETGALAIIVTSEYLVAMVGGLEIFTEECPDCKSSKLN